MIERGAEAAFAEAPTLGDLARCEPAWLALAERAAEPNAFGESDFLAPALARLAAPRRVAPLLVWGDATRQRLIGAAAIERPRLPFGLARLWFSEQAGLAALLLDRDAAELALGAILDWLRREGRSVGGFLLPSLQVDGAHARVVAKVAERRSLRSARFGGRSRAVLPVGQTSSFEASLDKKRRKEWARQRRRLEERGRIETRVEAGGEAIEAFLDLEARGWKGGRGSALALETSRAAFAREMLAGFAGRGRLEVFSLRLAGEPIAIGLALRSQGRAFYWKTAYDERYAEFSPGLQLTLDLSRRLERELGLDAVDSCAAPGHPMIDRLWPGRMELADFALALDAGPAPGFVFGLAAVQATASLRRFAKGALVRLSRRKRS